MIFTQNRILNILAITGAVVMIIVLITLAVFICFKFINSQNIIPGKSAITEAEARAIAIKSCVKGGETLAKGIHNEITKTWWFDANLNAVKEGCNPACVVSEETKTAEMNWRCTGLLNK